MSRNHESFIRHYRAPLPLGENQMGTWFGEDDGIFSVREFVVRPGNHVVVAPFDIPFRDPGHPTEPPPLAGIELISLSAFQWMWEQVAQPHLNELARARPALTRDVSIHYFRQPFPAEFKAAEAASDIYTEYAAGVARRSFEVFADYTLVAPFDVGIPDVDVAVVLQAMHEGLDLDGEPLDPRLRPEEISHAVFEAQWEQHALPRLRSLAARTPPAPRTR